MNYTVLHYLEQTAAKYPEKIAFSDLNESVTWGDLVKKAKSLSGFIAKNFKPGQAVPIMCDKSVRTLEYFFASLYAGCFYSYFDSTFPDSRLESMIQTLNVQNIITEEKNRKKISSLSVTPLFVADIEKEELPFDEERFTKIIDTDPVYANFTSGSTGTPKAVVVSHRSLIDFISCFTEIFNISSDENFANQAPFDFDVSVKDIFSAVFTGATVHLVPKMFFSFPVKLLDFLEERQITTLVWAVSALCIISTLNGFSYKIPKYLKKIMFSGEVMPVKQLNIWRKHVPQAEYINLYGPTEITCNCTYFRIKDEIPESGTIPIGIPFPNERVFLLDENNCEVTQENSVGELCVSGTCVALGYYNSSRTEDVFVQNPLQNYCYERIYKTGDLAKYGSDGLLYYVSRKDNQIKHMGHRIELGEIEKAVSSCADITRSCCIFLNNKIYSFYTGVEVEKKNIIATLKKDLPTYMIPSSFIFIKEFPLTKNGKIDKKALEALINE